MYELKTNTAVRIAVGPLVDPTDGKTAETSLTVTDLSVQLYQLKNDGSAVVRTQFAPTASGGNNDMALVTSSTDGMYDLELTAAQLNFLGNGRITFYDVDGFLVHWIDILVVSAAYFDWKYGATIPDVNTTKVGGTTQTARDIGASVLLSSGTGTGQLDFTSGIVKSNLVQILAAALSGTAAQIVAAFVKFFDKASPTGTVNSLPDAVAGASGGLPTTNGTKVNQTVDLTAGQSIACSDKTGFSLSSTGADLILKSSTFVQAIAAAINELATYGLTAINTLLVTTGIKVASVANNAITAAAIATDAIDADALKADAITEIQNGLATPTNITAGTITTVTNLTNAPTNGDLTATMKTSVTTAATAATPALSTAGVTAIVTAVWAALTSGLTTAGSIGKKLADWVVGTIDTYTGNTKQTGDAFARIGAPAGASVSADVAAVKGDSAAILTDTNELQTDWHDGGRLDLILDAASAPSAAAVADAVWDEALSGHSGAGTAGLALATASSGGVDPSVLADAIWDEALSGHSTAGTTGKKLTDLVNADLSGLATAAALDAVDNFLDTEIAAILADTNELQTDLVNGGRLDLLIDAIKAKTDNLPVTPANEATLTTIDGIVDNILADTNELQTDWTNGGRLDLLLDGATAPTAAQVADAVWDEVLDTAHEVAGSASVLVQAAGSAADPWLTALPGAYGAGTAGEIIGTTLVNGVGGGGSHVHTYTVTDADTGVGISGVIVVATNDSAGLNEVLRATTNGSGVATFHFTAAGTYYFWSYKPLYQFVNPDTEAVA